MEERGQLHLDLEVGVGRINVVLGEEPTFAVVCQVPADAMAATGPVTCPHPPQLASTAMTCSVVLADLDGIAVGQGFCRRLGAKPPPAAGSFASTCIVPDESDQATCTGLNPSSSTSCRMPTTGEPRDNRPPGRLPSRHQLWAPQARSHAAPRTPPASAPAPRHQRRRPSPSPIEEVGGDFPACAALAAVDIGDPGVRITLPDQVGVGLRRGGGGARCGR